MTSELQEELHKNVVNPQTFDNYKDSENFKGSELINIYHNQYFASLTNTLSKTYSCIKRLVGDDFFNMLAIDFIKKYSSKSGSIVDYGKEFANFLKQNKDCQTMPFLSDIANLEYAYERCYFTSDTFFVNSNYPIVAIWQLTDDSDELDLSSGKDNLKIYKKNFEVVVEKI